MCRVWEHVTPVSHGLNRPEQMAEGMASFAAARGLTLTPGLFVFPSARTKRPPYEQVEAFVRRALERDCPVAFLNLHNGRVKELDYWHWVTITALEDTTAVILDSGSALRIDLRLWYETTKRRGGFVGRPWGTRHEVIFCSWVLCASLLDLSSWVWTSGRPGTTAGGCPRGPSSA